ncbi:MAG: M4 family metallopeptidase [Labilithrix sp.]|nr:M4 family metallopeptidase [Labilithrix sp.]MCW5811867.1 M4 family metallopeptidase [Labilithrix sp.]
MKKSFWWLLGGTLAGALAVVEGCSTVSVNDSKDADPKGRLERETGTRWIVTMDPATDTPLIATAVTPIAPSPEASLEEAARAFLAKYEDLFKIKDTNANLAYLETVEIKGGSVVSFQQRGGGLPVDRHVLTVSFRADRSLTSITGVTYPLAAQAVASPAVTPDAARAAVEAELATRYPGFNPSWIALPPTPEQVLFPEGAGAKLAWALRVGISSPTVTTELSYRIDAQTGAVLEAYDAVPSIDRTGSGYDVIGIVPREFTVTEVGPGNYRLGQTPTADRAGIITIAYPSSTAIASTKLDEWDPRSIEQGGMGAAVSAQANVAEIEHWFRTRFDWKSFDNKGTQFQLFVHDTRATSGLGFWTTSSDIGVGIHFSDGDSHSGGKMKPLSTSIEFCTHEFMHGVIENRTPSVGLIYQGESGAVNEALADIFGMFAKAHLDPFGASPEKFADMTYNPGGIRNMAHPSNPEAQHNVIGGGDYVARDSYQNRFTGAADNGGVHINSGILSNAWYLMTYGGTHDRSQVVVSQPLGIEKSEDLWWDAMVKFVPRADIEAAAVNVMSLALERYGEGSSDLAAVVCAFVGIEYLTDEKARTDWGVVCGGPTCADGGADADAAATCTCVNRLKDITLCKTSPENGGPCTEFGTFTGLQSASCTGYMQVEETENRCDCRTADGTFLCQSGISISPQACADSDYDGKNGGPCSGTYLDLDADGMTTIKSGTGTLVSCQEIAIKQVWAPSGGVLQCTVPGCPEAGAPTDAAADQ